MKQTTETSPTKMPINILWRMRQANGLELKQVARLLGNKSTDNIARYEKGNSYPNLKTAFKLLLIYNSDLREMFPGLVDQCRLEMASALKKRDFVMSFPQREKLAENINSCTFEEMSNKPNPSEDEKTFIHNHIRKLSNKLSNL